MAWLLFGGLASLIAAIFMQPTRALATPFASPISEDSIINEPYVTFQNAKVTQQSFQFSDGIPITLVILILVLLLGLVILYLSSLRPKH